MSDDSDAEKVSLTKNLLMKDASRTTGSSGQLTTKPTATDTTANNDRASKSASSRAGQERIYRSRAFSSSTAAGKSWEASQLASAPDSVRRMGDSNNHSDIPFNSHSELMYTTTLTSEISS